MLSQQQNHAPIANQPNSAQLEAPPMIPLSYIQVRAVVWECGEGQTDRQTDRQRDRQTDRRPCPIYILPQLCLTGNVTTESLVANLSRW